MAEQPYRVELAKSDRSTCTATREKIAKGELRFGALVAAGPGGHGSYKWRKMACVTAKQAANVKEALGGPEHISGFAELPPGQQAEVLAAFVAAESAPAGAGKKAKAAGAAAAGGAAAAPPAKRAKTAPHLPADPTAAAHALLDLAKANRWADSFRALDARPELVNIRPEVRQFSLLHQAIYLGKADTVARLLDTYNADVAQRTKSGETCAALAEARGRPEIIELIAARGRASSSGAASSTDLTPEKVAKKAAEGAPAGLARADIAVGALEAAHQLIDFAKEASWSKLFATLDKQRELVDVRPSVREYGLLHQAAYHGAKDAVITLIDRYAADPTARTKSGLSAVQVAQERGHADVVKELRSRADGAAGCGVAEMVRMPDGTWQVEVKAASPSTAGAAAKHSDSDAVDAHALIDLAKDARWTDLFSALDGARELVNERPDAREFSVLHQAAYHGAAEVVATLIDRYGADPAARSRSGHSAADVAEESGHTGLAQDIRSRLEEPGDDFDMVQKADGTWVVVLKGGASAGPSGR